MNTLARIPPLEYPRLFILYFIFLNYGKNWSAYGGCHTYIIKEGPNIGSPWVPSCITTSVARLYRLACFLT